MSAVPTVRVRIVVGMDRDGTWEAEGSSRFQPDRDPATVIYDAHSLYWVEVDLPIPQVPVVPGAAKKVRP